MRDDGHEIVLDLTSYREPEDLDAAIAKLLDDARQEDAAAERELEEMQKSSREHGPEEQMPSPNPASERQEEEGLPSDFARWSSPQQTDWASKPNLSPSEMKRRIRLVNAWRGYGSHHEDADHLDREPLRPLWADVAALLDGGMQAPKPDGGPARTDGARIMYRGKVNALIGDPESAKTLLALFVLADELNAGSVGVFVDTDHNGGAFVLRFLLALGVPRAVLISQFHYAEPDDRDELMRVVDQAAELPPGVVVLDSVGENLGLWGVSPNDDQGVLDMNRATAARLAKAGHLVVTIDHLAKNTDSRRYGATGSTAKLRAANGTVLEVRAVDEFNPDDGGKSALLLKKDRTGGVRALGYKRGETVAVYELSAPDAATGNQVARLLPGTTVSGAAATAVANAAKLASDVAALDALNPPPSSKDDVRTRLRWGSKRALDALAAWRAQAPSTTSSTTPVPPPQP